MQTIKFLRGSYDSAAYISLPFIPICRIHFSVHCSESAYCKLLSLVQHFAASLCGADNPIFGGKS